MRIFGESWVYLDKTVTPHTSCSFIFYFYVNIILCLIFFNLEKFKRMSQSRDFLRNSVAEVIKEVCNIEIDLKKIEVKNYIARINEKPIIKTEIFLKKIKILENLDKKTGGKVKEIF
ncbi:MAG: hypothetical protein ABH971_00690 [bacterium]